MTINIIPTRCDMCLSHYCSKMKKSESMSEAQLKHFVKPTLPQQQLTYVEMHSNQMHITLCLDCYHKVVEMVNSLLHMKEVKEWRMKEL